MPAVAEVDSSLDPFRPEHLADPYPFYARLREIGPVLYLPSRKVYLATTFNAVDTALRDYRTFSSAAGAGYPICTASRGGGIRRTKALNVALVRAPRLTGRLTRFTMDRIGGWLLKRDPDPVEAPFIGTDPPQHFNNRRAVQPFFAKDAIEDAAPMVRGHVAALVDQSLSRKAIDAVEVFSELPSRVIADFMGVRAPTDQALRGSEGIFDIMGPDPALPSCQHAAHALGWLLADGVANLPDDSACMGWQIMEHGGAPGAGGSLARGFDRAVGLFSIWVAALDTTASLIGNMLNAFADHPDQWQRLRDNPDLAETAVEEALRFDSPIRAFFRTTTTDTILCDVPIPADARVATIFASANRDPDVFADPDDFDIARKPNPPHLSFGASIHLCLGAPLARLESTMLLREMAARVSSIERTSPGVRTTNSTTRGFRSLPLALVPVADVRLT